MSTLVTEREIMDMEEQEVLEIEQKAVNSFVQSTPHEQQQRVGRLAEYVLDKVFDAEGESHFYRGARWMLNYIKTGEI